MLALFNNRAEKGIVQGNKGYHKYMEHLIGRATTKGHHGRDKK